MLHLNELLARPGLEIADRLLVRLAVAVWFGDAETIRCCVERYRESQQPRSDLEETLLQAVLFSGFPRVINAFQVLQEAWPTQAPPQGGALPQNRQRAAGEELFRTIYRENTESVLDMLKGCHGELHDFVMDTAYGRVLSRPGLDARVRELMAVGVLAATEQVPQLIAHGRGALRCGAAPREVEEAVFTGCGDPGFTQKIVRRIG